MEALDKWLAENAQKIDLQVRIFENELLNRYQIIDIDTKIQINHREYWGRGTHKDKYLALRKSCCEAVERFFLHKNMIYTSNGVAAHTHPDLALRNAQKEVVERDLFLCHFFTQTPFLKIAVTDPWILGVIADFDPLDISIEFFSMGIINNDEAILCAISGLESNIPFGYILGTAAGSQKSATIAAFFEAFRNFAHLDRSKSMNLSLFLKKSSKGKVSFIDHGNLALEPDYAIMALKGLLSDPNGSSISEKIELDWTSERFDLSDTPFEGAPIFVCRASTPLLQDLFVGETKSKHLNERRLTEFSKAHGKEYNLFSLPHPFN